jgi:ApeA N-terminal domain 1
MALLPLPEVREFSAAWNVPGSTDTIPGRLAYSPQRAELDLDGTFTPMRGAISVSDDKPMYPVIHGLSSQGEALSLLKAQTLGVNINLGGAAGMRQRERIISAWVIVGAHVTPESTYPSVRFFVPGLEAWLSRPAITQRIEQDADTGETVSTFVVRQIEAETTLVPSLDCELDWGLGTTQSTNPFNSIDVRVLGWIVIRPHKPRSLEWFLEQQSKLSTLLAFLAGVPMPIYAMQASVAGSATPLSILVTLRQAAAQTIKNPNDFFVPRGALGSAFGSVVARWFSELESVLVPSRLALSVISADNLWLHVEFLSLVQALEGFHRGRFPGAYVDEPAYVSIKASLMDAIPPTVTPDHRDALRSRIRYGNQISLSKRLSELRDCLGERLASLVIAEDGKVPRSWIDTRNYHSHWDEELRPKAIEGQAMYNANVRMEHFLRVLYLLMAGVPQETLLQCLGNISRTSQQLLQLNLIARRAVDPSAPPGVLMTIDDELPGPTTNE